MYEPEPLLHLYLSLSIPQKEAEAVYETFAALIRSKKGKIVVIDQLNAVF
jgi:hypothetical protein